jgi:hypothetical protein
MPAAVSFLVLVVFGVRMWFDIVDGLQERWPMRSTGKGMEAKPLHATKNGKTGSARKQRYSTEILGMKKMRLVYKKCSKKTDISSPYKDLNVLEEGNEKPYL